MRLVVDDLAKKSLLDIYYHNYNYSIKNAIETNRSIVYCINELETFPYIRQVY